MISTPDRQFATPAHLAANDTTSLGTALPLHVNAAGYNSLTPAVVYTPAPATTDILVAGIPAAHLSSGMVLFWISQTMKVAVTPAGIQRWATSFDSSPDETVAFSPALHIQEGKVYRFRLAAADANTFSVTVWENGVGGTPSVATMSETALFTGNPTILFGRPTNAVMTALGSAYKIAAGVKYLSSEVSPTGPTAIAVTPATIAATATKAGEIVGMITTTHPSLGFGFGYTLVAGTGDTNNANFEITAGPYLRTSGVLTAGSKSVRIQTKDIYGLTYAAAVTITVS